MKNKISFFVVFVLLFSILGINVYAYEIMFGTMNFAWTNQYELKLAYRQLGNINHTTAVNNGRLAWNQSAAHVYVLSVAPNTGENITVDSKDYGNNGWHGLCQAPFFLTPDTSFIKINDYYYNSFKYNAAELVSHEMGHSFRLGDVSDLTVLMRSSGYKGSANPEQDDVDGVNSNY